MINFHGSSGRKVSKIDFGVPLRGLVQLFSVLGKMLNRAESLLTVDDTSTVSEIFIF